MKGTGTVWKRGKTKVKSIIICAGWVLFNLIIQLAIQLGMSVFAVHQGMDEDFIVMQWIMNNMLLMTLISNILFIAAAVLFHKIRKVNVFEEWKMKKIPVKSYVLPCAAAFLFSMAFSFFTFQTSMENALPIQTSAEYYNEKIPFLGLFLMIINLLVMAPAAEEVLCRGIMVTQLRKGFSLTAAVVISSVIFGLIHIPAGGFSLAAAAAVIGIILGTVYVRTGSLYAAFAAHLAANLPDFIFKLFPWMNHILKYALAGVFSLLFAGCMLLWLRKDETTE